MCTPQPTPLPNLTRIVGALRTMNNLCQYIMHLLSCINYLYILIINRVMPMNALRVTVKNPF